MSDYLLPLRGTKNPKVEIASLTGGPVADVTPLLVYFITYSSLDDPFMTASVVLSDESNIMSQYNVNGDMAIIISGTAGNGKTISAKFHINSYKSIPQNNRKSQAVELHCIALEHIHNDSQKITLYEHWYDKKPITILIDLISRKYLAISKVLKNAAAPKSVNINIPRMHPAQAIAFLNERAVGPGTKSLFTFYQKFDDSGEINYYCDEVSILANQSPKWTFIMNEGSYGLTEGHTIDASYVSGGRISKVINVQSDSWFNAHDMVKQGYASRTYIKMDFVNKTYERFDDTSQHTVINKKQMPQLVGIANSNRDYTFNRTIYEPFNGDETYYTDPLIEEGFKTSKPVAAGLLGKRFTLSTYGCPDVNTGDVVRLIIPEYNSSEQRPPDPQYSMNYLVYATQHSVDGNGDFMSKYELVSDGQGGSSGAAPGEGSMSAAEGTVV